ncbi:hypothetical protein [Pantoea ananatis]|nr:hypothetical protein [Pantoea ananatis]
MKRLTALLLLCALSGCVQRPALPGVSGPAEPVNSPKIIQELSNG